MTLRRIIYVFLWSLLSTVGAVLLGALILSSGAIAIILNAAARPFGKMVEWCLRYWWRLLAAVYATRTEVLESRNAFPP